MNGKPIDYIHTRKVNNNKTNTKNNSKFKIQWDEKENLNTKNICKKKTPGVRTRGSVKNIYFFTNMRWAGAGSLFPLYCDSDNL